MLMPGLLAAVALAACSGSAPTHYYALTAMAGEPASPAHARTMTVVPVKIPEYLNHAEVITREGEHGLKLDSLQQWAEPLDLGITRVLSSDLGILFRNDRIVISNAAPSLADLSLWVQIRQFEVGAGGTCMLSAAWALAKADPDRPITRGNAEITEKATAPGYDAAVGAMNRALETLSRRIADELRPSLH